MKATTAYKSMMKKGLHGPDAQNTTFGMIGQSINNKGGKTLMKTKPHPAHSVPGKKMSVSQPIVRGKGRQTKVYPQVAKGE